MREVKDQILSDAIKTSIRLNYEIACLKRVIALLCIIIATMIICMFVV